MIEATMQLRKSKKRFKEMSDCLVLYLQAPETEDDGQHKLFAGAEPQATDSGDRKDKRDYIERCVSCTKRDQNRGDVQREWQHGIPLVGNGNAF